MDTGVAKEKAEESTGNAAPAAEIGVIKYIDFIFMA